MNGFLSAASCSSRRFRAAPRWGRRAFTALLLLGAMYSGINSRSATAAEAAADRPNILFIYADDQSYKTVSCYPESYDWVRTPNIDSLARSGVRFTRAYIGTWCMPSRATMLTGHLQFGVNSMRMEGKYPGSQYDPAACPFWPAVFRKNGYVTAHIGKWHTGTDTGYNRDWDYQKVWNRPRHIENAGNYYYDQLIETNGGKAEMAEGYSTDNYTDWAVDFIKGAHRPEKKPWFLWVCYGAVHGPFLPDVRHRDAYPDPHVPTPADIYPPRAGKPTYSRDRQEWIPGPGGEPVLGRNSQQATVTEKMLHGNTLTGWVRQYNQGVLAIDEGVGRLLQALDDSGQRDNTLIVYTADQGFAWGEHGFRLKLAPYDATIRSPMLVSYPQQFAQGAVCDYPIDGPSLPPTFFAAAGIELPWKMHGSDLTPLLKKPDGPWSEPAVMAYTGQSYGKETDKVPSDPAKLSPNSVPWWAMLVAGRYKYIRTLVENEPEELYDLQADPDELVNLARRPKHREQVLQFRKRLVAELTQRDAGMVNSLPEVAPLPEKQASGQ
ncbi:sulfatase-like hydrolase/transferase [Lignipirellula cremea]|uniref:Arylsulfatase n=1 Tax=Lignipirellula cremea TaxID=2528010 RepID=A0A518E0B0_9BACT|nr:sulfatase-like hydrolase/transferase [Lignipirellula cremea]QDU97509.1 Arylsulfatase [Lignipirellula cremea]